MRAVKRVQEGQDAKQLERLADSIVEQAINGDLAAFQEIANRIDGKLPANVNVESSGSVTHVHEGLSATDEFLGIIAARKGSGDSEGTLPN